MFIGVLFMTLGIWCFMEYFACSWWGWFVRSWLLALVEWSWIFAWVSLAFFGTKCFNLFSIPIVFDILLEILSMWYLQLRCSFIVRPWKLNSWTYSIWIYSIFNCKGLMVFWDIWNIIYLLLLILNESVFSCSHSFIDCSS